MLGRRGRRGKVMVGRSSDFVGLGPGARPVPRGPPDRAWDARKLICVTSRAYSNGVITVTRVQGLRLLQQRSAAPVDRGSRWHALCRFISLEATAFIA